jgi:hypothetical protein
MTSESTRFLGQPREINPTLGPEEAALASWGGTVGAAGGELLITVLLYVGRDSWLVNREQLTANS